MYLERMSESNYRDDWPTCAETFVTLAVYPSTIPADQISTRLGLQPTSLQEPRERTVRADGKVEAARPSGWFLSSKSHVLSRDARHHLDWLLDALVPLQSELERLRSEGATMNVSRYWLSAFGHWWP